MVVLIFFFVKFKIFFQIFYNNYKFYIQKKSSNMIF